jgi:diacylglycerol O-acyltransferase / wax synthase
MAYCHYERLSAMDSMFLDIEDHNSHMHIGSVAICDGGPLRTEAGGIDIDSIHRHVEGALAKYARFRQRLAYVPGLGRPVWIDDPSFNLNYHIRHTCLPAPGDERQLKRLAGRVMSQQLDRGKPLWEVWFVEGVDGDRFAVITKLHHCLADGISGVDLASSIVGPDPNFRGRPVKKWLPRPAPSGTRLLADELRRRATAPLALLAPRQHGLWDNLDDLKNAALGLAEFLGSGGGGAVASETPFDTDLGPHRRFDWTRFEMADVKRVKQCLDGKLNDVVLAVVTGAMRQYLRGRGMAVESLNFRVMVPVSVRDPSERGGLGNRVSAMLVRLPLELADPLERFRHVTRETAERKSGHESDLARMVASAADATVPELTGPLARLGMRSHAVNLTVTNVPGPPLPMYLLGAEQLAAYPVVPLATGQALGIALLSYAGGLHWGFNADWDALPDLHDLVDATNAEFALLCAAAAASRAANVEATGRAAGDAALEKAPPARRKRAKKAQPGRKAAKKAQPRRKAPRKAQPRRKAPRKAQPRRKAPRKAQPRRKAPMPARGRQPAAKKRKRRG